MSKRNQGRKATTALISVPYADVQKYKTDRAAARKADNKVYSDAILAGDVTSFQVKRHKEQVAAKAAADAAEAQREEAEQQQAAQLSPAGINPAN